MEHAGRIEAELRNLRYSPGYVVRLSGNLYVALCLDVYGVTPIFVHVYGDGDRWACDIHTELDEVVRPAIRRKARIICALYSFRTAADAINTSESENGQYCFKLET